VPAGDHPGRSWYHGRDDIGGAVGAPHEHGSHPAHDAAAPRAERLRRRLSEERERARRREATLTTELADIIASTVDANTDDEHDPEGATIAFERAQVTELLRTTRLRLTELEAAAGRLERGTYGVCSCCGRPIPIERLLARPSSDRCVACASSGVDGPT
jgi:DnaK suppressor protein